MSAIISLIIVALGVLLLFKNDNAYKNHSIINQAIHNRQMACVRTAYNHNNPNLFDEAKLVDYRHKELYVITLFRLWDWGYTRILPKEKFDLIKRYIY